MGSGRTKIVKLASSENPLGMRPKARKAVETAIAGIERYPDQFDLIRAVAERCGVATGQVVLGRVQRRARPRCSGLPGAGAVGGLLPARLCCLSLASLSPGRADCAPARNYGHDLDAMRMPPSGQTPASSGSPIPNNPPVTFCPIRKCAFLQAVPNDVVVVLDEAYNEYLPPAERVDTAAWIGEFPNLVVTALLQDLRPGWPARRLRIGGAGRGRPHEPSPSAVQRQQPGLAAAVAALDDHLFVADSYELNRRGMEQIVAGLKRPRLRAYSLPRQLLSP